jgi:hypothetical protein
MSVLIFIFHKMFLFLSCMYLYISKKVAQLHRILVIICETAYYNSATPCASVLQLCKYEKSKKCLHIMFMITHIPIKE